MRGRTNETYDMRIDSFLDWVYMNIRYIKFDQLEDVDPAFAAFFEYLYVRGVGPPIARQTLAAWMHRYPEFRKHGNHPLVRAWRCIDGWEKLTPSLTRMPCPWECACGIAVQLSRNGYLHMAVWWLVIFDAYARPSGGLGLRLKDAIAPAPAAGFPTAAVNLNASDSGHPSKTNTRDDIIRFSTGHRQVVNSIFLRFLPMVADPDNRAPIFNFGLNDVDPQLGRASLQVGCEKQTAYAGRHGGASDDTKAGHDKPYVQKRGRWAVPTSMVRYDKVGAVQQALANLPNVSMAFCLDCVAHLEEYVFAPHRAPASPFY